jgi:hypothetical protein
MSKTRNLGNLTDVLSAGSTYATATTPLQFDNSTNLATTAAVNARGVAYGSQMVINTTTTLTAALHAGREITVTAAVNVTLPLAATCPAGTVLHICSNVAGAGILRQGSDVISMTPSSTSTAMGANDSLVLMSDGISNWLGIGGTLQLGASGAFASSSASSSGYQKLPSGLIIQWGASTTPSGGSQAVTFPLAFPGAVRSVSLTNAGGAVNNTASVQSPTASGFTANTYTASTGVGITCSYNWIAIGY